MSGLDVANQMAHMASADSSNPKAKSDVCPTCGSSAYKAANKADIEKTINDDSLDPATLVKKAKAAMGIGG